MKLAAKDIFGSINTRPIIVLSSPRTGSSVLSMSIIKYFQAQGVDLRFFNEIHERPESFTQATMYNNEQIREFVKFKQSSSDYVFKCHLWDLVKYYNDAVIDSILKHSKSYKIRIRRKNFIDQLLSQYIGIKRSDKWNYTQRSVADYVDQDLEIDSEMLEHQLLYLQVYNSVLDNHAIVYDLDLYYEDLEFPELAESKITPRPRNYTELYNAAQAVIDKMPRGIPLSESRYVFERLEKAGLTYVKRFN